MIGPGAMPRSFPALMIVAPPVENQIAPREKDKPIDGGIGKERKKRSEKCMEKKKGKHETQRSK